MTIADMKADADKAVALINAAVAAIGDGGLLLDQSAAVARDAVAGSTRGDRDEAATLTERGKSDAVDAARHAQSAAEATSRWHDAL